MPLPGLRGRAAFGALVCAALLHSFFYPYFFGTDYSNFSLALYAIPAATALAFAAVRARTTAGQDRVGWLLFVVAALITMVLDVIWSVEYRSVDEMADPNWLDIPYVAHYTLYVAAIGYLTSPLWRGGDRRWLFDAGALLAVSAGLLWHFVLPKATDGGLAAAFVGLGYLVMDLAFFGTVISAVYRASITVRNSLLLVAAMTMATGDFLFYFHPLAFDSFWSVGLWLIAIAAATPTRLAVNLPPLRFARSGAVPYVFVVIIAAVTAAEMRSGQADDLLFAGVTALGFVVARQIFSLRMALAVQRQETAFREAVLETQSDLGLGMVILQDGRVVFANGAAERITGMNGEELKAIPAVDGLAFESERTAWREWLADPALPEDARFARPDGEVVEVEIVGRWLRASDAPRMLLVLRDITERRQGEQLVARAQRLEGLGALAGGVAHDFNNLLSAVLGNVGLLQMGELDDEAREAIESIDLAARRGATLTRSLLDFARTQPEQFGDEDLGECLAETVSLARTAMPANVNLRLDADDVEALVHANRGQLVQAFFNLILNARDAVGDSGAILVRLTRREDEAWVEVSDTGTGMDEATRGRVFEPFFTTKPAGAGTGLGLAISLRTFRDHRAEVDVSSQPGHGTTFTVKIPLRGIVVAR